MCYHTHCFLWEALKGLTPAAGHAFPIHGIQLTPNLITACFMSSASMTNPMLPSAPPISSSKFNVMTSNLTQRMRDAASKIPLSVFYTLGGRGNQNSVQAPLNAMTIMQWQKMDGRTAKEGWTATLKIVQEPVRCVNIDFNGKIGFGLWQVTVQVAARNQLIHKHIYKWYKHEAVV